MNKARDSSAKDDRRNHFALSITLILLGLILLERAFVLLLLPSQQPIFLGLYSGPKFATILICTIAGVALAQGSNRLISMLPASWEKGLQKLNSMLLKFGQRVVGLDSIRLFCSLLILACLIGLFAHPYIMGDLAFQLWPLHLRDLGFTEKLNLIPIPDPTDLSQSTDKHIVLYPPGVPWLLGYLMKTGLSLGFSVYLLGFAGFLSGGIACLKILRKLGFADFVQVTMAIVLATACLSRPGLSFLTVGGSDVFCFGLLPWGMYFAIAAFPGHKIEGRKAFGLIPKKAIIAAILLGIIFLLKYSQFTYACATVFFLCISCLLNAVHHRKKIAGLLATGTLAIIFLAPFTALTTHQKNISQEDALAYTERGWLGKSSLIRQRYGELYEESSRGLPLLATLPSAPGWLFLSSGGALSSVVTWLQGFTSIDTCIEKYLKVNGNIALSAILGLLCTWLIVHCGRVHFREASTTQKLFLLSLVIIPPLLLTHTSSVKGYNYLLSHENRFGIPAFVIAEALLLGYFFQKVRHGAFPIASKLALIFFFLHPLLASGGPFMSFISKASKTNWPLAEEAIYTPRLSSTDGRTIVETVRQLAEKKDDIIIFAGERGTDGGLLFESAQLALNFPSRCLIFDSPALGEPRFAKTNPNSFATSKELRVIFLLHKKHYSNSSKEHLSSIISSWKMQFPQAQGEVQAVQENDAWNFSVYWLDLSVLPTKKRTPISP